MNDVKILLYKGTGFCSRAIQFQTRSPYSHAAIVINGKLYEAKEFEQVQVREVEPSDNEADWFIFQHLNPLQIIKMKRFLHDQLGKDYDYMMVARFVSRRGETIDSREKWFCSELVFAAFLAAGIELLRRTEAWEVSPGMLARTPFLSAYPNVLKGEISK